MAERVGTLKFTVEGFGGLIRDVIAKADDYQLELQSSRLLSEGLLKQKFEFVFSGTESNLRAFARYLRDV
jgi:hypothetical protein